MDCSFFMHILMLPHWKLATFEYINTTCVYCIVCTSEYTYNNEKMWNDAYERFGEENVIHKHC